MKLVNLQSLLLASFSGRFIYAVSSLLSLPFLTKVLGVESVGLVGFFTTLMMVTMVLEGGLTSSIIQDLASIAQRKHYAPMRYLRYSYSLINTYLAAFVIIGLAVMFFVAALSEYLTVHWLNIDSLPELAVRKSIVLMGVFVGLNFPILIIQGALIGKEKQQILNALYTPYSIVRTLGVLVILYVVYKKISVVDYFFLQVVVQVLYLIALCTVLYYGTDYKPWSSKPRVKHFFRGYKFSKGVFLISLTSIFVVQFDKVYLSGHIPLEQYAVYALASTLASVPYIFSTALNSVLFPRFATNLAAGDNVTIERVFRAAFVGVALVMAVLCCAVAIFGIIPLSILFDQPGMAEQMYNVLPILIVGTALQSMLVIPYALQLAAKWTELAFRVNAISIPIIILCLPLLVEEFGSLGAAYVWFGYNVISFCITMFCVVRKFCFLAKSLYLVLKALVATTLCSVTVFYAIKSAFRFYDNDYLVLFVQTLAAVCMIAIAGYCCRKHLVGFK